MFKSLIIAFAMISPAFAADESLQFKIAPDTPANRFRIAINGGQYEIFASGEIDVGATERFQKFVIDNAINDAIVLFDSPGGSLSAGMELGRAIRSNGFNTGIGAYGPDGRRLFQGMCASSCAYSFAGGVYRFYYGKNEKLGIHQFYSSGTNQADMGDIQIVSSILVDYLQSMGVDPQAFVAASTARGDSMFWLTPEQATSLGLSNNGSDPTVSEIKMLGESPYLRLEQSHSEVTTRVLFGCSNGRITLSAGIVTTPELSREKRAGLVRNYLEIDAGEILVARGSSGSSAVDSVLWLNRMPSNIDLLNLLNSNRLGIWTESGGPMRWGAMIDLRPAKEKMGYFIQNCLQG